MVDKTDFKETVNFIFIEILNLNRVILIHRFKYGHAEDIGMPYFFFLILKRKLLKDALSQGYLAHSKDELYGIGIQDLKSKLSSFSRK